MPDAWKDSSIFLSNKSTSFHSRPGSISPTHPRTSRNTVIFAPVLSSNRKLPGASRAQLTSTARGTKRTRVRTQWALDPLQADGQKAVVRLMALLLNSVRKQAPLLLLDHTCHRKARGGTEEEQHGEPWKEITSYFNLKECQPKDRWGLLKTRKAVKTWICIMKYKEH